jgi:peroxiredoxin
LENENNFYEIAFYRKLRDLKWKKRLHYSETYQSNNMKYLLSILLIGVLSYSGNCQVKKIPAMINGKIDTLDFPNDFRNKSGIRIGEKLPSFTYIDIEGDTISKTDFDGKLLVLNFWFVGCVGCKQEEPYLTKMTRELKDENIEFVSICQSSPSRTKSYIKKNGDFGYKVISIKSKKEVYDLFGVQSFATHMIVKNGKIVENIGFAFTTDDEIIWLKERILEEL